MSNVNDWFLSLPERRRQILAGDKWALAEAAFEAGKEADRTQPAPVTSVEVPRLTDEEIDDLQRENNAAYHRGDVTPRRFARAVIAADRAKRVPMSTAQQVDAMHQSQASEKFGAAFLAGIRAAEAFHGIGSKT